MNVPSTRAAVGISLALMRDAQSLALDWKLKLHFLMNSKRLSNIFLFRSSCNICLRENKSLTWNEKIKYQKWKQMFFPTIFSSRSFFKKCLKPLCPV